MVNTDIVVDSFLDTNLNKFCQVPIIVVYKNTSDYPAKFVARLWNINNRPTKVVMIKDDIESIRNNIPKTMTKLERSNVDDPVIIETWI
jgi:hypothetical protein